MWNAGCFFASDFFNSRLVEVTLKKDIWSIKFLFCWLPKALEKLLRDGGEVQSTHWPKKKMYKVESSTSNRCKSPPLKRLESLITGKER